MSIEEQLMQNFLKMQPEQEVPQMQESEVKKPYWEKGKPYQSPFINK